MLLHVSVNKPLSGSSFINTNLIHNSFYKLHKTKYLYMFRASSAHLQEANDVNCICMQPLVSSFCAGGHLVQSLKVDCSLPLATAQDGHLQRRMIPVDVYIYNLHYSPPEGERMALETCRGT
jgi:hypothetical protein